jgi:hypothetical protein
MYQGIAFIIVVLLSIVGTAITKPFDVIMEDGMHVPNEIVLSEPTQIQKFMNRIAEIETPGGGYQTVNRFGMMGRYQFSPSTVKVLGFSISKSEFLQNSEMQDSIMVAYMKANEKTLERLIHRYDGRIVKGVKITRASIIAGAHFAGARGVTTFLTNDSHTGTVDANGTTLRKYMSKFSDFYLPPLNS